MVKLKILISNDNRIISGKGTLEIKLRPGCQIIQF